MFSNKKLVDIIGIAVIVVFVGVGAFMYFGHNQNSELLTVGENQLNETTTPSATPTSTIDKSNVQLPPSDNEGLDNLIDESENVVSEEELKEQIAYEEEIGDVVPEVSPEQIAKENKEFEEAQKAAANNSEVQKPVGEPIKIEPTTPEPKKDANGFIYTKEQAIQTFATEFQKLKEAGDFNYTYAYDTAIEEGRSTEESFASDLQQLLTDPYSSDILSIAFDGFRKNGDIGILTGVVSFWLSMGGDDGDYTETLTQ